MNDKEKLKLLQQEFDKENLGNTTEVQFCYEAIKRAMEEYSNQFKPNAVEVEKLEGIFYEKFTNRRNNEVIASPDFVWQWIQDNCLSKAMNVTDEDINEWVKSRGYYGHCTQEYHEGLEEGAKWIRDKLTTNQTPTT